MVVWCSGSALFSINKVNLRRALLIQGWVTVSVFNSWCATFISCNQPPRSTQTGHHFMSRRNEYQPNGSDWRLVAGVRVWATGETVWAPCYTRAISEHFGDKGFIIKRYINSSVYFPRQRGRNYTKRHLGNFWYFFMQTEISRQHNWANCSQYWYQ